MPFLYSLFRLLGFTSLALFTGHCTVAEHSYITKTNHAAPVYNNLDGCLEDLSSHSSKSETNAAVTWLPEPLNLLSWNIKKGQLQGWHNDLQRFAKDLDLVLLQEAVLTDAMKYPSASYIYWSFSRGYVTDDYTSGVMTISRQPPQLVCSLMVIEPWLRTPKLTSITRYYMGESKRPVLIVNLHAINFSLGVEEFSRQLEAVIATLSLHTGPIILSGDFNTWRAKRYEKVSQLIDRLGLQAVTFSDDQRSRIFGRVVDFVFIRGFQVLESTVKVVATSDHNPILVRLAFDEEATGKYAQQLECATCATGTSTGD